MKTNKLNALMLIAMSSVALYSFGCGQSKVEYRKVESGSSASNAGTTPTVASPETDGIAAESPNMERPENVARANQFIARNSAAAQSCFRRAARMFQSTNAITLAQSAGFDGQLVLRVTFSIDGADNAYLASVTYRSPQNFGGSNYGQAFAVGFEQCVNQLAPARGDLNTEKEFLDVGIDFSTDLYGN